MVQEFIHKGLERLSESGISSGVNPQHIERIRRTLALLETAEPYDDSEFLSLKQIPWIASEEFLKGHTF